MALQVFSLMLHYICKCTLNVLQIKKKKKGNNLELKPALNLQFQHGVVRGRFALTLPIAKSIVKFYMVSENLPECVQQ